MSLIRETIPKWYDNVLEPIEDELKKALIEAIKTKVYFPRKHQILRAFKECPYEKAKVIIVGQDPYPGVAKKDVFGNPLDETVPYACGLSFSVEDPLQQPPSLKVIIDAVNRYSNYEQLPANYYSGDLSRWARQGVLLLNRSLTVEPHKSGSHKEIWNNFFEMLMIELNRTDKKFIFVLYGKHAQEAEQYIDGSRHYILEDIHPVYTRYNPDAKFDGQFELINDILLAEGSEPINFKLPKIKEDEEVQEDE